MIGVYGNDEFRDYRRLDKDSKQVKSYCPVCMKPLRATQMGYRFTDTETLMIGFCCHKTFTIKKPKARGHEKKR